MKEHYVTYDQAVKLKELGFDWECDHSYLHKAIDKSGNPYLYHVEMRNWNNFNSEVECFSAPRLDQAQAWMREVKGWDITSIPTLAEYGEKKYRWDICHWSKPEYGDCSDGIFDSYELALSAGIDKALELLTDKD